MPGGDRRGPEGYGSQTGRGAGFCAGFSAPGYVNAGGRAFGGRGGGCARGRRGGGFGRFYGRQAMDAVNPVTNDPTQEARYLNQQLDAIQARLDQLKRDKKGDPNQD